MRVIHTADWHLGQRFSGQYRREEHDHFLDWLYQTICEQQVEVLVIAGDVFDASNPPAFAQQQYYGFLARLLSSPCCRHIIVTGGNHDSPHLLQAASPVLKALNIQVIGAASEASEAQILALPNTEVPELMVVAVPFLRDADLRRSQPGESSDAIEAQVKAGIEAHYQALSAWCAPYRERNIPILATGHLFVSGSTLSDTERSIHVGTLGSISADCFGTQFDYVALGHLHRPQLVGGQSHIRYCGSPLPLSFSEWTYPHQVLQLDFKGAGCPEITVVPIPLRRRLLRKEDSLENLLFFLQTFEKPTDELPPWLALVVTETAQPEEARRLLRQAAQSRRDQLMLAEIKATGLQALPEEDETAPLLTRDIMDDPASVFRKLLDQKQLPDGTDARTMLEKTFFELLDGYYQQPNSSRS
ncbi:MAG: exonuclease SbcCD subunit D [Sphingobacteriales bacterium]|nr:MAG: exonuclease SbcCD subunit D [Sphingobacteriales bacterium]